MKCVHTTRVTDFLVWQVCMSPPLSEFIPGRPPAEGGLYRPVLLDHVAPLLSYHDRWGVGVPWDTRQSFLYQQQDLNSVTSIRQQFPAKEQQLSILPWDFFSK